MDKIKKFKGKYYFLSNYYSSKFTYNGITYLNSEAAFHAQKCPDCTYKFSGLSPNIAKSLGRRVKLRDDWEDIKLSIMEDILRAKFNEPELKQKLIATYPAELIEENHWNDKFWGVNERTGEGENNLGKILMKLRDEYMEV